MSGRSAERLLDGFVRNPGGLLQKGMETVINQKAAKLEAATLIERFGAESVVAKRIWARWRSRRRRLRAIAFAIEQLADVDVGEIVIRTTAQG